MRLSLIILTCLASGLIRQPAFGDPPTAREVTPPRADLYVAVGGRDDWSGKLPSANAAGTDGPLATLGAARDKMRALKQGLPASEGRNLNVVIRGGTYVLTEAVVFGIEDSAPGDSTITYESYPGETPIFTSAVPVTNWTRPDADPADIPANARGQLWTAPMPEGLGRFYSLYDAEGLLPRARTELFLPVPAVNLPKPAHSDREFYYPEGTMHRWPNLEDVELYSRSRNWTVNLLPLQGVDERTRLATTALPATYPIEPRDGKPSVAVENVPEGLTGPGRWTVNTLERKVYLWPRAEGEPRAITAPRLQELIRVEGTVDVNGPTDVPVKGLRFRGLTLTMGDRDVWTDHDSGIQHDWEMIDKPDALIRFRGALRCALEDCRLTQSGGAGVRFDLFAQECRVTGCEVSHLGQAGILFLGYGPGTKDVNHHNLVLNCDVHHCGEILPHSHGIILFQSGSNRVAYNDLHDLPRKAVCITGVRLGGYQHRVNPPRETSRSIRWWEIPTPPTEWKDTMPYTHSRDNRVEYNRAERCVNQLSDGSVMNVSGAGEGNTFYRNYIRDTFSPPGEGASAVFRTDDDQTGSLFEENVVVHANVYGYEHKRQNRFVNNILIDVSPRGFVRWWRQFGPLYRSEFERNIFIDVRGDAIFYRKASVIPDLGVADIDHNLYWRVQDPEERKAARGYATGFLTGEPFGIELDALRALGLDQHSLKADPLLMDWRNEDYRLRSDSPAHALGIRSIDVREMGRRGLRTTYSSASP